MKQIIERINLIMKELRLSPNSLAIRANISPANMHKMLKGEQTITDRTLLKICDAFSVNFDWLKDGDGEPYYNENDAVDTKSDNIPGAIPYYDEEIFTGGYLQGMGGGIMEYNKVNDVKLPFLKVRDGDFAVQVHGRSMIDTEHPENSINDGAIVCLRPWTLSHIEWGERYAVATDMGFSVKYLVPSDKEGYIKCVPANKQENFAPYYINMGDVTAIAKVTAIINLLIL